MIGFRSGQRFIISGHIHHVESVLADGSIKARRVGLHKSTIWKASELMSMLKERTAFLSDHTVDEIVAFYKS